jgi:hypothetical protein
MRSLETRKKASASDVEQTQEAAKEPKPAQETPKPLQEQSSVSQEQAQPAQEQAQPAQEQTQPAQELAKTKVATAIVQEESDEPDPAASLKETVDWIRKNFANKFTYQSTAAAEDASSATTISDVSVAYEPLKFEGCRIDWRDLADTLSVSLAELDPDSVKVEPRSTPNTTFSIEIWNLSISASGGAGAIREMKGDGSGVVNAYSGLDLRFNNKARAERMARALQSAIKFCRDKSK